MNSREKIHANGKLLLSAEYLVLKGALALAIPAAIHAALARLRQAGILLKSTAALEHLPAIRSICFDKTGTLTDPEPVLAHVEPLINRSTDTLRSIAAALEQHVSHPLARAFKPVHTHATTSVELIPGGGVRGLVDGQAVVVGSPSLCGMSASDGHQLKELCMTIDGQPAARFLLDTPLRHDAGATIRRLQDDGYHITMLSGDDDDACRRVARELDIEYQARVTPEHKSAAFGDAHTLYVGDGVNDLPALAAADVSIATLETTDLVKSRADAVLLTSRLGAIIDLLSAGRGLQVDHLLVTPKGDRLLSGIWVCSGTYSDLKPRSSSARASSATSMP